MSKIEIYPRTKASQLLDHSPIPVAVAGTVEETELYAYTIPGGMLGKKGGLRIELVFTNHVNETNVKKLRVKFGSTLLADMAVTQSPITKAVITITNRNDEASQICFVETESEGTVTLTGDQVNVYEDTTANQIISVTAITTLEAAQNVGGDSLTSDVANDGVDVIAHFPAHGYGYGDYVLIAGANETAYNGTFEIFGMSANYFHYLMDAVASASPATGSITARRYSRITLEYCNIEFIR